MNYQDYLDGLATLPVDVQAYIKKAVDRQNNSAKVYVNRKYLALVEKDSEEMDAINYLKLLTDTQWAEVAEVTAYYKAEQ